ncbi:hypothetical protein FNF27_04958 [Cafeteria roenbergensis]|uniref:Anaphase-promoting complex subunit 4 WD40 domain-containing protein n=1 Tax=Cafeteria roenbergensis TaxID=33653 RepID=A0A5A8E8W5_CAFRO|nr:hypothetical protein FNF27_04958 [Cafeteria roenbergensis]
MLRQTKHPTEMSSRAAKRPRGGKGADGGSRGSEAASGARAGLEWDDDEVSSDDDFDTAGGRHGRAGATGRGEDEVHDAESETADAKRLRLAREYIARLTSKSGSQGGVEDALAEDVAAANAASGSGSKTRFVAALMSRADLSGETRFLKGHDLSATAVAVTADGQTVYSASKDCSVIQWDMAAGTRRRWAGRRRTREDVQRAAERKRSAEASAAGAGRASSAGGGALEALARDGMGAAAGVSAGAVALRTGETGKGYSIEGHWGQVLALAVSHDGKHVVSAGRDWLVRVWDPEEGRVRKTLRGHGGPITGLAFEGKGSRVYSSSEDRTVKGWDCETGSFAETLFGHSTGAMAVVQLRGGRMGSAGGQDRTVRVWKLEAETQLVFKAPGSVMSLDAIASTLGGRAFVTGGHDGALHLWSTERKKPVSVARSAHGEGNGITALTGLWGTDLVASGSCDGWIRLWHVRQRGSAGPEEEDEEEAAAAAAAAAARGPHPAGEWQSFGMFQEVARAPARGFVNGLCFSGDGSTLVAAVGSEHRMGRWTRVAGAKPGIVVVKLPSGIAAAINPALARATA